MYFISLVVMEEQCHLAQAYFCLIEGSNLDYFI